MQYTQIFLEEKFENFIGKMLISLIFSLKTYIVGTRSPRQGGSNSVCIKKFRYTPTNTCIFLYKICGV